MTFQKCPLFILCIKKSRTGKKTAYNTKKHQSAYFTQQNLVYLNTYYQDSKDNQNV